jgi:hypothetical protein
LPYVLRPKLADSLGMISLYMLVTKLTPNHSLHSSQSFKMGYEDSVYLAKLAEQAERYEGTFDNAPI